MDRLVDIYGDALSFFFRDAGFYMGSLGNIIIIFLLSVVTIIRRRVDNIYLSKLLESDCKVIRSIYKKNERKGTEEIVRLLSANRYAILGGIGVALIKGCFALLYAFGLQSSKVETFVSGLPLDVRLSMWNMIRYHRNDPKLFALLLVWMAFIVFQMLTNNVLSRNTILDPKTEDMAIIVVFTAAFIFAPIGFGLYILIYTIFEYIYALIATTTMKEKNEERLSKRILHYRMSNGTNKHK